MRNRIIRAAAAVPISMLLFSAAAAATTTDATSGTGTCEDQVYKVYNSCLMASDNYWHRVLCDYAFAFNLALCRK
jgi:hypothetical protein